MLGGSVLLSETVLARLYGATEDRDPVRWVQTRLKEEVWSKQREIMHSVRDNRRTAVKSAHGLGKALALDTPIPTPSGWTTMGELVAGNEVYDEQGKTTKIVAVSETWEVDTYRVTFDDGSEVVCAGQHEWTALSFDARRTKIKPNDWRTVWALGSTIETTELASTIRHECSARNWMIPTTRPIEGHAVDLHGVSPYVLGYWLGDGSKSSSVIALGRQDYDDVCALLEGEGENVSRRDDHILLRGLRPRLRALGVCWSKHVPNEVKRAEPEIRRAVLAGLADSAGHAAGRSVQIGLCNERLANDVYELAVSLGYKTHRKTHTKRLTWDKTRTVVVHSVCFTTDEPLFRIPRKRAAWREDVKQQSCATARTVVAIEKIETVPTRCIEVDSSSHLFLAGWGMVPTHNSHIASRCVAEFIDTHGHEPEEIFVVTTAPTFPQVRAILWRYIGQAHRKGKLTGRVTQTEWHIGQDIVAYGRKPSDYDESGFQGIHAPKILIVVDEACGIPSVLWVAIEALMSNEDCHVLAIGNPDDPDSHFYTVCQPNSGWNVITISAFDSPNFTDEAVSPKLKRALVGRTYVEDAKKNWGEDSPLYISKVLGEFPKDSEDSTVPASKIAACRAVDAPVFTDQDEVQLGVDVGAGGDESIITERRNLAVGRTWKSRHDDPMQLVGEVVQAIRESGATRVCVDSNGVGWGPTGRLREMLEELGMRHVEVVGVNVGEAAENPKVYANLKAELWWEVGRLPIMAGEYNLSQLEDQCAADLAAPKYKLNSRGQIVIESKDEVRKRIGRSTDCGDSFLLAFYRGTKRVKVRKGRDLSRSVRSGRPGRATVGTR